LRWLEITDAAKTREVLRSEEVKGHMKEAGVVGPPRVHVITLARPAEGSENGPALSFGWQTLSSGYFLQKASPASMIRALRRGLADGLAPALMGALGSAAETALLPAGYSPVGHMHCAASAPTAMLNSMKFTLASRI
jgi:hypothetical protein